MEIIEKVEPLTSLYRAFLPFNTVPETQSSSSISSSSQFHTISRSSTPATEVSDTSSFVIPVETPEARHRREQSDQASSEIGRRLLKGWALLGDECLNEECFGVPLVRPPKAGGEKDPRKVRYELLACFLTYTWQ
jgi:hypothetical protein